MKAQFYILGLLLRYGPQHGYMLKQTVEEQISDFAQIKLPTIYYHLEKLNEQGYITAAFQKDGNRPEKTVYSITGEGENYFHQLLKKLQSEELKLELPLDGAIFFRERLDKDELSDAIEAAILRLEAKLKRLRAYRDEVVSSIPDAGKAGTKAIFNHHIYHIQTELKWLKEMKSGI